MRSNCVVLVGWARQAAASLATLLIVTAAASAADMPELLPPAPHPVPLLSGWYVRGDLGWHWGILDGAQSAAPFPSPTNSKLDDGLDVGLGAGVKTEWLRTDVTFDFISSLKYQGTIASTNDTTAKIQADTALFNGYIDLGTWYHVTPYIGLGAGAAYTDVSGYSSTGAPPFSGDSVKKQWGFAWAAMAGLAVPISHNMMIDVGYRYLNIGDVKAGSDAFGAMTFKNVAGHEARIGLRWSFDDIP
jgi:opacity protein-like surface antigen